MHRISDLLQVLRSTVTFVSFLADRNTRSRQVQKILKIHKILQTSLSSFALFFISNSTMQSIRHELKDKLNF